MKLTLNGKELAHLFSLSIFAANATSGSDPQFNITNMPVPAPAPAVNAWDKPIKLNTPEGVLAESAKYDKGDQHDSGIDISETQNSANSSTRSSPSGDSKIKTDDILKKVTM